MHRPDPRAGPLAYGLSSSGRGTYVWGVDCDDHSAARRHRLDQLARMLDELDIEHGPVPEDIAHEVASWWPDVDPTG